MRVESGSRLELALQQAADLLDAPIAEEGEVEALGCYLVSPLDHLDEGEQLWRTRSLAPFGYVGELTELLMRVMRHLTANPEDPANVEAYRLTYTFPARETPATEDAFTELRSPNSDSQSSDEFVDRIIGLAHRNRELADIILTRRHETGFDVSSDRMSLSNESKFVLVGDKGTGKTTYVNYLISGCSDTLDEHRVILVTPDASSQSSS